MAVGRQDLDMNLPLPPGTGLLNIATFPFYQHWPLEYWFLGGEQMDLSLVTLVSLVTLSRSLVPINTTGGSGWDLGDRDTLRRQLTKASKGDGRRVGQTLPSCRGADAWPVRTTEGRKQPQSLSTTLSPAGKWAQLRPVLAAHVGVQVARKQLLTWPRAPSSPSSLWITWTALLVCTCHLSDTQPGKVFRPSGQIQLPC